VAPGSTTTYTLTGEDLNGCTNTASFTQQVSTCSGLIHQASGNGELKAYPNPFTDRLTIASVEKGKQITVSNAFGAIVLNKLSEGVNSELNLEQLANGIYFLQIDSLVIKIVKQ